MLPSLMSFLLACFVLPPLRLGSESHKHHLYTFLYYSGQRVGIYQVQILAGHNGFMALLSKDRIEADLQWSQPSGAKMINLEMIKNIL